MNSLATPPDDTRYLYMRIDSRRRKGLLDLRYWVLSNLLGCARKLGRVPVLSPLALHPQHNLSPEVVNDPQAYFDFDGMEFIPDAGEPARPMPYELAERLPLDAFPASDVCTVTDSPHAGAFEISREDDRHRVLVLNFRGYPTEARTHKGVAYRWTPPFTKHIQERAKRLVEEFAGERDFISVKLRRADFLNVGWLGFRRTVKIQAITTSRNVAANLRRFPADMPIYLMTDEPDDHYYDSLLRERPQLRRYSDYPDLHQLRHPIDGTPPNNYHLFAIEYQVHEWANIRLSWAFHSDWAPGTNVYLRILSRRELVQAALKVFASKAWRRVGSRLRR